MQEVMIVCSFTVPPLTQQEFWIFFRHFSKNNFFCGNCWALFCGLVHLIFTKKSSSKLVALVYPPPPFSPKFQNCWCTKVPQNFLIASEPISPPIIEEIQIKAAFLLRTSLSWRGLVIQINRRDTGWSQLGYMVPCYPAMGVFALDF